MMTRTDSDRQTWLNLVREYEFSLACLIAEGADWETIAHRRSVVAFAETVGVAE